MRTYDIGELIDFCERADGSVSIVPKLGLPCQRCAWMQLPHDRGHCYMFQHAPVGGFCAQFKPGEKP
jgi:hypothetical protein